jgi:thermitase
MPNDSLFSEQWYLPQIEAPHAWDISKGETNVVVAVLDTGVDLDHEDLHARLLSSWDAVDSDSIPEDVQGHGTSTTGVACASTDNGLGVAGVDHQSRVLHVRCGDENNEFSSSDVFQALEYCIGNPRDIAGIPNNTNLADVISMSFAFGSSSSFLLWGTEDAYHVGAVLVASAGNDDGGVERWPAAYDHVIAVAATDPDDERVTPEEYGWGSNYGDWVDVAAPGVNIKTTFLNNGYTSFAGTSASCPMAAGVVGLMLSRNRDLSFEALRQVLIDTSDPVTGFPAIVGGRINAYQALLAINRDPELTPLPDYVLPEDSLLVIDLDASDADGDSIEYGTNAAEVLPSVYVFDAVTGHFEWTPGIGSVGVYDVAFAATDGYGVGADTTRITVTPGSWGDLALALDGDGDYVEVPDAASLELTGDFTIEAVWCPDFASMTAPAYIVPTISKHRRGDNSLGNWWLGIIVGSPVVPDGTIEFLTYPFGDPERTLISAGTIADGHATHVALTYDDTSDELRLYFDGAVDTVRTMAIGMGDSPHPIRFGVEGSPDAFYAGSLDEIRLWNVLRGPEEIAAWMDTTLSGSEAGLVGYWRFDDGAAGDWTVNGNDGVLVDDATVAPDSCESATVSIVAALAPGHDARPRLDPSEPNPFGTSTTIRYFIPQAGRVRVSIYDVHGRRVATLVEGFRTAGRHTVTWRGLDESGRATAPGVYFVRMDAPGEIRARKIIRRQ